MANDNSTNDNLQEVDVSNSSQDQSKLRKELIKGKYIGDERDIFKGHTNLNSFLANVRHVDVEEGKKDFDDDLRYIWARDQKKIPVQGRKKKEKKSKKKKSGTEMEQSEQKIINDEDSQQEPKKKRKKRKKRNGGKSLKKSKPNQVRPAE